MGSGQGYDSGLHLLASEYNNPERFDLQPGDQKFVLLEDREFILSSIHIPSYEDIVLNCKRQRHFLARRHELQKMGYQFRENSMRPIRKLHVITGELEVSRYGREVRMSREEQSAVPLLKRTCTFQCLSVNTVVEKALMS